MWKEIFMFNAVLALWQEQSANLVAEIQLNGRLKIISQTENNFESCRGQFIVTLYTLYNKPFVKKE